MPKTSHVLKSIGQCQLIFLLVVLSEKKGPPNNTHKLRIQQKPREIYMAAVTGPNGDITNLVVSGYLYGM